MLPIPLYTQQKRPMRIVVFVSGGGGNLRAVIDLQDEYPGLISVDLVISDRPEIRGVEIAQEAGIPTIVGDFEDKCGRWDDVKGNPAREIEYKLKAIAYHDNILSRIQEFETQHQQRFDLAVLAYRRWIHGKLLGYFKDRMINQHAGDLTILNPDGSRAYVGIDPVYLALSDGQNRTRTSTIMVGEGHDAGEILCQGPWVGFTGDVTRENAKLHELEQKKMSDWPAIRFTLKEIAQGQFALGTAITHPDGTRQVFYRGEPVPHGGIQLGYIPNGRK